MTNETPDPVIPGAHHRIDAFEKELTSLINRYSMENTSDTPDYILARYMLSCLIHFNAAVNRREKWFGRKENISLTGQLGLGEST